MRNSAEAVDVYSLIATTILNIHNGPVSTSNSSQLYKIRYKIKNSKNRYASTNVYRICNCIMKRKHKISVKCLRQYNSN